MFSCCLIPFIFRETQPSLHCRHNQPSHRQTFSGPNLTAESRCRTYCSTAVSCYTMLEFLNLYIFVNWYTGWRIKNSNCWALCHKMCGNSNSVGWFPCWGAGKSPDRIWISAHFMTQSSTVIYNRYMLSKYWNLQIVWIQTSKNRLRRSRVLF